VTVCIHHPCLVYSFVCTDIFIFSSRYSFPYLANHHQLLLRAQGTHNLADALRTQADWNFGFSIRASNLLQICNPGPVVAYLPKTIRLMAQLFLLLIQPSCWTHHEFGCFSLTCYSASVSLKSFCSLLFLVSLLSLHVFSNYWRYLMCYIYADL
jgi:hypothetical protein